MLAMTLYWGVLKMTTNVTRWELPCQDSTLRVSTHKSSSCIVLVKSWNTGEPVDLCPVCYSHMECRGEPVISVCTHAAKLAVLHDFCMAAVLNAVRLARQSSRAQLSSMQSS